MIRSPEPPLILGIDGGGSSTEAVLADAGGQVLGRARGGPSNCNAVGWEEAVRVIAHLAREVGSGLRRRGVRPDIVSLGLAGVDRPAERRRLGSAVRGLGIARRVLLNNDMVIALAGAFPEGWGVVVNAGTGAIAFGVGPGGKRARADGWGYLLGDAGSGYFVGRAAIAAVLREQDGRGGATGLTHRILRAWRLKRPEDLLPRIYGLPRVPGAPAVQQRIAALAPLVLRAASEGDRVAREIREAAALALGESALAVIRRLGLRSRRFPLALLGGLLEGDRWLRARVARLVRGAAPGTMVRTPDLPALAGAVVLGAGALGLPAGGEYRARLGRSLREWEASRGGRGATG